MKNMLIRSLTGAVFIAIIIGSILWSPWAFFVVFCAMTFGSAFEFFSLVDSKKHQGFQIFSTLVATMIFATISLAFLLPEFSYIVVIAFPLLLLIPIVALLSHEALTTIPRIMSGILSVLLVAVPFSTLTGIRALGVDDGKWLLLAFFLTIWSFDTFAYLTGYAFGKHRLYEKVSPKKSWEGAIGGLVFACLCTYIFYRTTHILTLGQWIGFGVIVSVVGTLGDLSESLFKRALNVKDSGNILPGHGGLLDRFDSTIFAAPFILAYLYIINYCI
ncbi:MAG: phosphatidate cytidylyltransferase [Bacteroidales bacterium]|nr:phosphatidate cytidylyltransferase [Bacteroidales bacterium]